jgi:hypothetical protein
MGNEPPPTANPSEVMQTADASIGSGLAGILADDDTSKMSKNPFQLSAIEAIKRMGAMV